MNEWVIFLFPYELLISECFLFFFSFLFGQVYRYTHLLLRYAIFSLLCKDSSDRQANKETKGQQLKARVYDLSERKCVISVFVFFLIVLCCITVNGFDV